MTDGLLTWVKTLRTTWALNLKALRSGVSGTSELRGGRRVDTTLETIAEQKKELAELDALIVRGESEYPISQTPRPPRERSDSIVGRVEQPRRSAVK